MPRVVVEAMAVGTAVITSRLGTYPDMINHGRYGMLFETGNAEALAACLREFTHSGDSTDMRKETRRQFDSRYSGE
jgi:glycosyltransferase involved in cell wall biosynthesis